MSPSFLAPPSPAVCGITLATRASDSLAARRTDRRIRLTMRIDAHQHFWRYDPGEYAWIDDAMQAIRRDFLPADLAPLLATARLDGTVAVQARQSVAETEWLLQLSRDYAWIKGVVAWLPLAQQGRSISDLLDRYASHVRFKGVRHVLQAEPDAYFFGSRFNEALDEVAERDLTYDLLIHARQLRVALSWVDRHPTLRIVLDHIAKPVVSGPPPPDWCAVIRELARRPNLSCKFSGVVTEVPGWRWTTELLRPYFDFVLETFGPNRVMFGSDWPVCLVASDYARWFTAMEELAHPLSPDERAALFGQTAAAVYRLTP